MRPIDADELLKTSRIGKVVYFNDTTTDGYTDVLLATEVEHAPTVEIEPVKYGKWLELWINHGIRYYTCSVCRANEISRKSHYCPDCGAKMNGDD